MSDLKMPSVPVGRIVFLDYLRIFAFVSVLVWHNFYGPAIDFVGDKTFHSTPRFILELALPFFWIGGAGVVVFFLVSGYIITHVLKTERPLDFAVKRIFRIYPLYIFAVFLQFLWEGKWPEPSVLLPQLFLVGDFFDTPTALTGVEWTLRVEILFYAFMGLLRCSNLLHERERALPWILLAATLLLGSLPLFPSAQIASRGYVTLYGPFLFMGAFFCLRERNQVGSGFLSLFVALVLFQYYSLVSEYRPDLAGSHFATLAVLLFALAWHYRGRLKATASVLILSDLTYSVYLFHAWMWAPIKEVLNQFSVPFVHPDIRALLVLFAICFTAMKFVEKPANRLGRTLLARLHGRSGKRRPL